MLQAGLWPAKTAIKSTIFTIFEGTSEIQRMIIGRAVTASPSAEPLAARRTGLLNVLR
jgi:hypothetical protein